MKRILCMMMALVMLLTLCACEKKDDEMVITMFAGLGNNGNNGLYYAQLHDMVKQDLGIELRFTYLNTNDTSTAMIRAAENNDLPADIMVYSNNTPADIQKKAFVNLSEYSDICSKFTYTKIKEATVDGGVYQLPFSSKLIGIAYNKTLLEELGFDVPHTIEDMKTIKAKCDKEGIIFAEGADIATGHGFNLLFNLMGSEWLVSPDGTEWFDKFIAGEADISEFKEACEYFKEYAEAGLFGEMLEMWDAPGFTQAASERCLFYYCLTSQYENYTGFQLEDGDDPTTIVGAKRDESGDIVYTRRDNGNVVIVDYEPKIYNENNKEMEGLTRYDIGDAVILDDEWAAMPWPNTDGDGSFALYDNMLISLNKNLEEPKNKAKLEAALQVLDYLTTQKAADLFKDFTNAPDGYIAVKDFDIDESRNYSDFEEEITSGYIMRRAYPSFDNNTIINTGEAINDYLRGNGDFNTIFDTLQKYRDEYLNNTAESAAKIPKTLGYEYNAKFQAVCAGLVMQNAVDSMNIQIEVQAALVPYIESPLDLQFDKQSPVCQAKLYARDMTEMDFACVVQTRANECVIVKMTGAEINALLESGFDYINEPGAADLLKDFECPEDYGPYAYALMTRDGIKIRDGESYYVAVPKNCLPSELYESLENSGNILTINGEVLTGNIYNNNIDAFPECGIAMFIEKQNVISKDTIKW